MNMIIFPISISSALAFAAAATLAVGAPAQGIYTCVDAKGRKLTSDRPIPECVDREQKMLNPSGTVGGKLGPTLTAQERADLEAKEQLAREEQVLKDEEKRRDRALLMRYPTKAIHDAERAAAVQQVAVVKAAAANRVAELAEQRKATEAEMEFYKKNPKKIPASLRRQLEDVEVSTKVQERFIADQDNEIKRVNTRFDEEMVRLKMLWAVRGMPPPAKK
jgi:Domain of unknown function (DUF4124)